MAENRNITYSLTFKIDSNVVAPAKLLLTSQHLSYGKWASSPPSEILTTPGGSVAVSFTAEGASCSATGTSGSVVYTGTDDEKTTFTLTFDIPYSAANSGNLTGGSANFNTTGGQVPVSGNSVSVDVTIEQVEPVEA